MRKVVNSFSPSNLNICFGCSKESSHWDVFFEYPHHMFWMRNKENKFPIHTLFWRPGDAKIKNIPGPASEASNGICFSLPTTRGILSCSSKRGLHPPDTRILWGSTTFGWNGLPEIYKIFASAQIYFKFSHNGNRYCFSATLNCQHILKYTVNFNFLSCIDQWYKI